MTEDDALMKMIPPGTRRKKIWRNGVLQIFITRACDKKCFHCTQNSQMGGKAAMITLGQMEAALDSLNFGTPGAYFGVVGFFGGNPALHPQFAELCELLRAKVPLEQRGLWCNHPRGKAAIMRQTFNPKVSNLNVHESQEAFDEFAEGWPECRSELKGLEADSRHAPALVAMQDLDVLPGGAENTEENRLKLIADCDINKYWSAMICPVRDQLRAFFCEIAAAQAMLHQNNQNWRGTGQPMPDTGLPVTSGWWKKPMEDFRQQVRVHCHACGIPLRGYGSLANSGVHEQISETHISMAKFKDNRQVMPVTQLVQLGETYLAKATDYIENGRDV